MGEPGGARGGGPAGGTASSASQAAWRLVALPTSCAGAWVLDPLCPTPGWPARVPGSLHSIKGMHAAALRRLPAALLPFPSHTPNTNCTTVPPPAAPPPHASHPCCPCCRTLPPHPTIGPHHLPTQTRTKSTPGWSWGALWYGRCVRAAGRGVLPFGTHALSFVAAPCCASGPLLCPGTRPSLTCPVYCSTQHVVMTWRCFCCCCLCTLCPCQTKAARVGAASAGAQAQSSSSPEGEYAALRIVQG